ncbi:MAG TPA: CHRD domain-containing protein [Thermoanaerobaculia bacterium]|nr:CHRD domain-containing protein [Thermoanaerobaculia bacterium]
MIRKFAFLLLLAIVPAAFAQSFSASLAGANEVPGPGDTDGAGLAVVTISGTTVNYQLLVQNIAAPTLAHIHRGAVGVSGPVVVDFAPTFAGGLATGSVTGVSPSLISEIAGNPSGFYVNVHTSDFPNGAIRGQLGAGVSEGAQTSYLAVVGKVTGANNTNFVTDVRLVNPGSATANVTLDYFQSNVNGLAAPTATKSVTVAPGEQKVLDDVIGATLTASGLGGLRITSDRHVVVTARVINDLRASNLGTTGFAVASLESGKSSGTIAFLSQASGADVATGVGFRTNVGYFNASASPITATFTARRASDGAALGASTITIPPFSQVQQGAFQLIPSVADVDRTQPNFYITYAASAPLFVYGSVVDNKTGDSVLIQ